MHLIFSNVSSRSIPLLKILSFFCRNIFYISIKEQEIKKSEVANKLRKIHILPLPIELEEKLPDLSYAYIRHDFDEDIYKQNVKLVPNSVIKNYCDLFSIDTLDKNRIKKIRLLIQSFLCSNQDTMDFLKIWADIYTNIKIIYLSFNFRDVFIPKVNRNILKVIIPFDILNIFAKIFIEQKNNKNKILNKNGSEELDKKSVAFVVHKGLFRGTREQSHFEKKLYYSDDINSPLNKRNILHLDYENFSSTEPNLHWVCLKKKKVSRIKIFFKTFLGSIKTLYLIRSWSTFLGWVLCNQQYSTYLKYSEIIKKFKNLKIALIDYDCLCPKTLLLAFEKKNIRTVSTQDRFPSMFYNSFSNVFVDTYYAMSDFAADVIKQSKYYCINNLVPVGIYKSEYISSNKKEDAPDEIAKAKKIGKKIIVALGHHSPNHWYESYTNSIQSWSMQKNYLEDYIKLSQNLNNAFIILRYKTIDWAHNRYFEKTLKKINDCENIILSNDYKNPLYSYKLCAHADLVIAKLTSLVDDCIINNIPVLFHEYTHNMTRINSDIYAERFNYFPKSLMCYNFEELLLKSKSFLLNDESKIRDQIVTLNRTIYRVENKYNPKDKIHMDCIKFVQNN
jgi:hypothetical protein